MLKEEVYIKLNNESGREFSENMVDLFKKDREVLCFMNIDNDNNIFLFIVLIDTPYLHLKEKNKKGHITLMYFPKIDKTNTMAFTYNQDPIATEEEYSEIINIFNNRILTKYNKKYNKKYKLLTRKLKYTHEELKAFNEYFKAQKRRKNQIE